MIRLGFSTRLFIIFVTSLVALQLLVVLAFFVQRSRDTDTGLRMPLPDQAAALVELLEGTPKAQWPLILRATSSTDLRVRISDTRPETREPAWYEMPLVDFILRRYLASLGGREVRVRVEPSSELFAGPLKALAWVSPGAVEIEVGLKSGEYLIVATGGLLSLSALGFPPGFWAGVLGFAVAVVTVLMVRREARPAARSRRRGRSHESARQGHRACRRAARRARDPRADRRLQPPLAAHRRSHRGAHGAGRRHLARPQNLRHPAQTACRADRRA